MILKKIKIMNYRQLQSVELDMQDSLTVLAGPNNSGKTTLISVLKGMFCDKKLGFSYSDIPISLSSMWLDKTVPVFQKIMLEYDKEKGVQKIIDEMTDNNKFSKSLKTLYTKLTGKTSNVHKYYVLRWDEPSNLIPAHLFKDGLRHIHPDPEQARTITVREAARLQTFPDDYYFNCSQTDAFKMIGNAVPPLFAKKVAYAIYHLIQEN